MDRIALANKITEITTAIEKASYIADDLQNDYSIVNLAEPTEKEKNLYVFSCGRISNYISILDDYIREAKSLINSLAESI